MDQSAWLPRLGLVNAMLIWASSLIALKIAFHGFDPMFVIWARMVIGSLCFCFFFRRLAATRIHRRDLKLLLLMAFCEPCIYFIFEAMALQLTTASQAGLITAMLPLMVALGAHLFLAESVPRKTLIGFSIAIGGACWLSLTGEDSATAPNQLLGNLFEFLAMTAATGYTLLMKHLSARYSALFLTAVQSWTGTVFFSLFLLSPETNLPQQFPLIPTLAVCYLGCCVTLGAYLLYNYGVGRIPASQASAYINLIPVFAVILGILILGETFTASQVLASALVLFGVFYSQRKVRTL